MLRKINKTEINEIQKEINVYGFCLVKNLILKEKKEFLLKKIKKIYKDSKIAVTHLKGLPKRDSKDLRIYNLPNQDKIFIE